MFLLLIKKGTIKGTIWAKMNLRHSLWSIVTVCDSTSVIQSNTRGPGRCGDESWQEVMWHEALTCWTRRRCQSGRLAGSARWRHARLGRRLRRENAARLKTAGLGPTRSRTGSAPHERWPHANSGSYARFTPCWPWLCGHECTLAALSGKKVWFLQHL